MKPKITITSYQVNYAAGTLTFRERDMKVKDGNRQSSLRGSYTQSGETITLRLDELPTNLKVAL